MPNHVNCVCPNCQRSIAIPAATAPGSHLRCPLCQQAFPWPPHEAATRSLVDAPPVTATLPPAVSGASHEAAKPNTETNQATCTLDPHHAAKPESAQAPKKIGRFEVRRVLGEGGFGIVYEAYDPQLDRAIALKVAKLGGDSEQRIKRFLREAKSAANLRHPHIVPLFEFGQDGDQFYLALAYIPGQSLDHVLSELNAKKEKMDCRRAATLVRHLAEALTYAHGLGIVHRDIKPHNVMLDERGDPLLMDFGLATPAAP
jgi:predicted Ser/Thr protein kinase